MNRFLRIAGAVIFASGYLARGAVENSDNELYFESHTIAKDAHRFELRPSLGLDFSHPYLNIYSGNVGLFWRQSELLLFGVELSGFGTTKRESLTQLEDILGKSSLLVRPPQWSSMAVVRFVPFSSLTNVLSQKVVITDISFGLRAGVTGYVGEVAPAAGALFDVNFSIARNFGIAIGMNWDLEKLAGFPIQSRMGFRMGPTLVF